MPENITIPTADLISDTGDTLLESARDGIKRIRDLTAAANACHNTLRSKLDSVQSLVGGIDSILNHESADEGGGSDSEFGEMSDLLNTLTAYANEVLDEEYRKIIEKAREAPDRFDEAIETVDNRSEAGFQAIEELLTERSEALLAASVEVRERANEIAAALDEAGTALVQKMDDVSEKLEELFDAYESTSTDGTAEVVSSISDRIGDEIELSIDEAGGEVLKSLDNVNDTMEAMFGEATAALEDINSVFEDVVDIVEPLMPVLDEISALT